MDVRDDMLPPAPPIRPHVSLAAFFGLMKNKDDTTHVFKFSANINGDRVHHTFRRWMAGPNAKLLIEDDPTALLRALDDRDRLRALPVGTVGRAYADFMDEAGFDTDGINECFRKDGLITPEFDEQYPEFSAFVWYLNLTHDMYHILTGYSRDGLGELAVINMTSRITRLRGLRWLSYFGALRIKAEAPEIPVGKILRNAKAMGLASADLLQVNFIDLLDRPLREVREELNITPDPVYQALPRERLLALVAPQAA